MKAFLHKYILYIAWIQALVAMIVSLYYSEIKHFIPCALCWYQRILMYPLVIIIAVGILRKDKKLYQYVLPMSILGMIIAFYQILLQNGILSEIITPCKVGVSCLAKYTEYLGFITIPVMSFSAFSLITVCLFYHRKFQKEK